MWQKNIKQIVFFVFWKITTNQQLVPSLLALPEWLIFNPVAHSLFIYFFFFIKNFCEFIRYFLLGQSTEAVF